MGRNMQASTCRWRKQWIDEAIFFKHEKKAEGNPLGGRDVGLNLCVRLWVDMASHEVRYSTLKHKASQVTCFHLMYDI